MKLENGTAEIVYNNQKDSPLYKDPVFQIIKYEKIDKQGEDKPRVRVNLSDGVFYIKGIFSSTYTNHFERGLIKNLSLVKLNNFFVRSKNDSYFVYIQRLEEYENCDKRIGNPVNIVTKRVSSSCIDIDTPNIENFHVKRTTQPNPDPEPKKVATNTSTCRIVTLNPYQKHWTIKGSVLMKSEIRHFKTQNGNGKVFSFEIADDSAQVKVVCFSEVVDIFFQLIEVGKSYTITNGTVKMANKQFTSNNFDYEIHLEKTSEVKKMHESIALKQIYNFTRISDVIVSNKIIDVIGVIKEIYPTTEVKLKSSDKMTMKRDLIVVDESGNIKLTVWGSKCDIYLENDMVIALKSVKTNEYNGINLSTVSTTQFNINPDVERAFEIKGWYETVGINQKLVLAKREEKKVTIQELRDDELEYGSFMGSFMYIKEDNLYYDSCTEEGCNKKVFASDNGMYRCEKCNKTIETCNKRYIITAHIGDFSGQIWSNIFDNAGCSLFGSTAKELDEVKQENSAQLLDIIKKRYFKEFMFKVRGKMETYNNESRMKYSVLDMIPLDVLKESNRVLNLIEKFGVF